MNARLSPVSRLAMLPGRLAVSIAKPLPLATLDLGFFLACAAAVYSARLDFSPSILEPFVIGVGVLVLISQYLFDSYSFRADRPFSSHAVLNFSSVFFAGLFIATGVYVLKPAVDIPIFWRGNLPSTLALYSIYLVLGRLLIGTLVRTHGQTNTWSFIGSDKGYEKLVKRVRAEGRPMLFERLDSSVLFEEVKPSSTDSESWSNLHEAKGIRSLQFPKYSNVVIERSSVDEADMARALAALRFDGMNVCSLDQFYEIEFGQLITQSLDATVLLDPNKYLLGGSRLSWKLKRITDIFLAILGIVAFAPLIGFALILIKATSRGPGFFTQTRTGLFNKPFQIIKLRTMVQGAEQTGLDWTQPNDERITRVGRLLRQLRIDELPQVWNVLVGQMSFIGPRPERPDIIRELITQLPYVELRHIVRPGITGWAQVQAGYASSVEDWAQKLEYDLFYIKKFSLVLEIKILAKTLRVIVLSKGR